MRAGGGRSPRVPPALVVLGGALSVLSAIPKWFSLTVTADASSARDYSGVDLETVAWAVGAFGFALIVIGVAQHVFGERARTRGVAIVAAFVAVIPILTGAISLFSPAAALGEFGEREVAADFEMPGGFDVDDVLQGGERSGELDVGPGPGAYGALLGGLIALAGAGLSVFTPHPAHRSEPETRDSEPRA